MAANLNQDEAGTAEKVVLAAGDGAWYEVPIADLEWTTITDPGQLEDLRSQIAAGGGVAPTGDAIPVALLSPEVLAAHRVDAKRAVTLEAEADDVAGLRRRRAPASRAASPAWPPAGDVADVGTGRARSTIHRPPQHAVIDCFGVESGCGMTAASGPASRHWRRAGLLRFGTVIGLLKRPRPGSGGRAGDANQPVVRTHS